MEEFEAFVAARGPALRRFAYVLCGDRQRPEDLVQSALARVLQHWLRVSSMQHPEAYVGRPLRRHPCRRCCRPEPGGHP